MADSPVIRRPSPPIPPPRGAPGSAGARVAGQLSEEVAERLVKDFLAKRPGGLAGKAVDWLIGKDELLVKAAGFSLSEVTREAIFGGLQRLGINTESGLVRALADTPDNVIRGIVEAFAETAQGRTQGAPAPAQPAVGNKVAAAVSKDTVVVRIQRPGLGGVVHRSVLISKRMTGLCLIVREEEDKWNASHQATVIKDQSGGGGGGRGDRKGKGGGGPALKLADAEPFPLEVLTIADAEDTGFAECPKCQPYTFATAEEQKKEAAMAETTAAADAAKDANKPKPIEGWDEKVGKVGRWLARALDASVECSDDVDDKKVVPVIAWAEFALVLAHEILVGHPDPRLKSGFDADGKMKPLTTEQIFALPPRLNDEQVERTVRFIFGQGAGKLTKTTQLKALLDTLTGNKKKAEEGKKAAEVRAAKQKALDDAKAKVAAATNPVETQNAKAEVAKAEKALEPPPPPPPNPWPRRLVIGGAVTFGLLLIVTLIGVAVAMTL